MRKLSNFPKVTQKVVNTEFKLGGLTPEPTPHTHLQVQGNLIKSFIYS